MIDTARRIVLLLLGAAAAAAPAHAASIPFTGSIAIQFVTIPPIVIDGAGVATVNGSAGGVHVDSLELPAGAITADGSLLPISDPGVFPIAGLQVTGSNGPGAFAADGGVMPLAGVAKICLFGPCLGGAVSNLSIPLSVVGTNETGFVVGAVNLTVSGAPWTTGTITLGTPSFPISAMGFRRGPAGGTSSTAAPSGSLQLVTPIRISTNIGSSSIIPAFAVMTLHFVPEPATLGMVALALGGLAAGAKRVPRGSAGPR
jgi:hypothetical protein